MRALAALSLAPFLPAARAAARVVSQNVAAGAAHHLPDGTFRNRHSGAINKPFLDLLRWRREAPDVALLSFPLAKTRADFLANNRQKPTITWVGHATVLLQAGGFNIITDPHFSERASPFSFAGPKRGTPPGLTVAELPPLDAVLLSHNHYDHLDLASIAALARAHPLARFFTPLRLKTTVAEVVGDRRRVEELDWGGQAKINGGGNGGGNGSASASPCGDAALCPAAGSGLRLTAEPCRHWSRRAFGDRNKTLWASWVVETDDFRFLFVGDTGYSPDFAELGAKYGGFDAAALPIGAYAPRWFMAEAHITPAEAVQIVKDARISFAVATHWGTFILTDEPMDEPPQKLREALSAAGMADDRFAVFQHGETRDLSFLTATATGA